MTKINQNNDGKPLPATFSPQEQTEFALGYYQQIADNRTKKPAKAADGEAIIPDPEPGSTAADNTATGIDAA